VSDSPKKGDRYRARRDVAVNGIVTFGAPFTGGFTGILPRDATCIIDLEPPQRAQGVYLVPDDYARFETMFVSQHDRSSADYSGYAMSVSFDELARSFEKLENES
jgi:hypothetical protein